MLSLVAALALAPVQLQNWALLDDLSRRSFDFFWQQSHPLTGFTKDRAANFVSSDGYTVASVASTGYALSALSIGVERGWVSRADALARARLTANSLRNRASRFRGWFFHFIDWSNGARVWNSEASSIDTAILVAGLLVAEQYFKDPTLTADSVAIRSGIDWQWMLTNNGAMPNSLTFCHGWTPETGFISYRWNSYSEHLLLLIQALGSSRAVPDGVWSAFSRPLVTYSSITCIAAGPLYLHQIPQGFLDFSLRKDAFNYDYHQNSRSATLANRLYCINNPNHFAGYGSNFWGLSAADGPDGYQAFGAPGWGVDNGTINPAATVASMMFLPTQCQAAANAILAGNPTAYGRYGFANGLNPTRNWRSPDVIGIDLGMMLLGIENARDKLPWRLSMAHPVNGLGMKRAKLIMRK